ncbi:MAG: hypothetical protein KAX84_03880 [Burkholderiales bacterium]|nr:hypothetical protein [Burkholderiales bacterium]
MALTLVTPAAEMPVSVIEARQHCRASDAEDAILALYLAAATQAVQDATGRALTTETWRLSGSAFPDACLILPPAPLLAVSEVRYWTDETVPVDTLLAATVYQVAAPSGPTAPPGTISLAPAQSWPAAQAGREDAVRVTFTAGYGADASAVPAPLRAAVLLMTGSMYEFREADAARALTENPAVARLLNPYRLYWL